jgi:ribonuclease HI
MEKLLISRINYWAYSTQFLNTNQHGFTPQRSTVDAAMAVKNIVDEGLLAGEVIILVSLDIKNAFDAAWWPNIIKSLQDLGCPRNLYYLTKSYLNQRTAILSTNNIKLERQITKGCPQGSCCSPGLWNIQYNSLLNLNFAKQTSAIAFADDLILVTRGKTVIEAENFTNTELNKITAWAKNYKVEFNEEKSTVMLVSRRKRKENKVINIFLNFIQLKQVNKIKYLGIIMDNKFKFNDHITHAVTKCTKLIYSLSKSAKLTWGLRHNVLRTIYEGAILPLLMYGAPVWEDAMKFDHNKRKYMRAQRLMNLRIAKAFCTTSNEALCIVANTTPIMLKIEEVVKIYNIRKGRGKPIHNIDREVDLKHWQHPADEAKSLDNEEIKDSHIQVYTDGSKTQHGVGSGVALYIGSNLALQNKFKLDNNCSNNQAEQLAIIKALEAIGNIDTPHRTATIFTDSMITLESIRNTKNHNYLIEEIRKKMTALEQAHWNIEISWVKAHIGITGNELADQLAKTAANDNDNKIIFKRLPIGPLINKIKEETLQKWQKEWDECTKAETTKQFFPKIQGRQKLKIEITPIFTAMITGHGKTRAYLHRFKILENANCPCGDGDQNIDHLLNSCPILNTQRGKFKHNVLKTGIWPPKRQEIISKHLKLFLQFINSIKFDLL